MGTYADLKTRIVTQMVRDDLLDDLLLELEHHISDACEEYADRRFWFNQAVQSLNTVTSQGYVAVPDTMRIIDRVAGPYTDLTPVTLNDMTDFGDNPQTGLPCRYAYLDGDLRFDITPDDVYALTVYGLLQVDAPTADTDSNIWTNEAAALICAHTRMTLYRDQFRDTEGEAAAARAAGSHLAKLQRETERRLRTRPVARLVQPSGQPVRRGWLDRF